MYTFLPRIAFWKSPLPHYRLRGRLEGHKAPINRLSVSADGRYLASGSSDETVRLWNLASMSLIRSLNDKYHRWGQVTALKWFEGFQSTFLCIGTARGRLSIYLGDPADDAFNYALLNEAIFAENVPIEDLDFDISNRRLAASSSLGEIYCFIFDGTSLGKAVWTHRFPTHEGNPPIPRSVHFRGDELFVYLLEAGQMVCFDSLLGTEKRAKSFETPIGHAALSPDKSRVLIDNLDSGYDLYDAGSVVSQFTFKVPGQESFVKDACFVEHGSTVVCPSDTGRVYVFSVGVAQPAQILFHNRGGVRRVASHDGEDRHTIVSASNFKSFNICVWEKKAVSQPVPHDTPSSRTAFSLQWTMQCLTLLLVLWLANDKVSDTVFHSLDWLPVGIWVPKL